MITTTIHQVYFTYSGSSYVRKVTDSAYDSGTSQMTLTLDSTLGVTLSGSLTANVVPFARIIGDGHGQEIVLTANSSAANSSWRCNSCKLRK